MKERPILFSTPMVRAILDGRKTQTRRILTVQPLDIIPMKGELAGKQWVGLMMREPSPMGIMIHCKHGLPGDRLWVRETWCKEASGTVHYRADGHAYDDGSAGWKPSIHMFRKDSRITLEIVSVRAERLQDISEADAWAEGCEGFDDDVSGGKSGYSEYAELWEEINGAGSWESNPFVWAVEFKMIEPVQDRFDIPEFLRLR